ncbi:hypothetical protein D3C71_585900 [compost metagenome]
MKLLLFCFLLVSVFSCKKLDKKNPIEFTIKAHIPYSAEPISGVKYMIKEYRSKKGGGIGEIEYTDFELEGTTNANGFAEIAFFPKKKLDYMYRIYFDYSNIQFESYSGAYSLINAPSYDIMTRNDQRDYEIRALPHCSVHIKVENVNCFDANDKMRFKTYNCDEFPNKTFETIYVWGDYFNGCGLFFDGTFDDALSGRKIYQIEVTRNGQVTTDIDTFFLQPGIMNEVFIEY